MPVFLDAADLDFEAGFSKLLYEKREDNPSIDHLVAKIITDVRARGNAALLELTEKFDRLELRTKDLQFSENEISEHILKVSHEERAALELAAQRIRYYHERQLPKDMMWQEENGAKFGWRWTPVSSAGLYVPGGLASYPSSVLMNAIPAKVAGVSRLVVTVPTPDGLINPLVLLAAKLSGVSEIYRIGGAQAIASLAYGTESIAPVDKITGPGNAYVAAAKRQVFGKVGIDMIAGPSEILIIADAENDPDWIALDLLAQAEHDESAQSILITTDASFAKAVANAVEERMKTLIRKTIAEASWRNFGAIITVPSLDIATNLCNRIAPEHLELCVSNPHALSEKIKNAGAIFLGAWTPEAIGDYIGGPNHVLPTTRSARFSSGLSVLDFMKRTTLADMSTDALLQLGPAAATLAKSETLQAHSLSVLARLKKLNEMYNSY